MPRWVRIVLLHGVLPLGAAALVWWVFVPWVADSLTKAFNSN